MIDYILSILGIVVVGVIIDVIIPSGSVNKYIKSIYSIFVVAVLLMPLIKFVNSGKNINLTYKDYEIEEELLTHISNKRVEEMEETIEKHFITEGFKEIDIQLNYSLNNNKIEYNSCTVNLQNMVILADKQHINKYEFIKDVVSYYTNLSYQEIIINEW